MATHSNILAWEIPWAEEPAGLQSMRSQSQTRLSDKHTHMYITHKHSQPVRRRESSRVRASNRPYVLFLLQYTFRTKFKTNLNTHFSKLLCIFTSLHL